MKHIEMTDQQFAKWLRKRKALDNYHHVGHGVMWANPSGDTVALAIFDNRACTRKIFIKE